ncbi:MAG: hypothetical protein Q8876_05905, partial [Bacillota bacterium]|nr:hypothetical protein [Bacillota bacterium]
CDIDEKPFLVDIEKLIHKQISVVEEHLYPMLITTPSPKPNKQRRKPSVMGVYSNPRNSRNSNGAKTKQKHTEKRADFWKKDSGANKTKKTPYHNKGK